MQSDDILVDAIKSVALEIGVVSTIYTLGLSLRPNPTLPQKKQIIPAVPLPSKWLLRVRCQLSTPLKGEAKECRMTS